MERRWMTPAEMSLSFRIAQAVWNRKEPPHNNG
jgi:hypothetical protein